MFEMKNLLANRKEPEDTLELEPSSHDHEWKLTSRTYAPPRRDSITELPESVIELAMFGLTTYLWECVICKETKQEKMLGSDTPQLDELLDKTEIYGPQYVQREGKTYIITRYINEAKQDISTIPLR